jgi:hypothetical protein
MERQIVRSEQTLDPDEDPLTAARGLLEEELPRVISRMVVGYHCELGEPLADGTRTMVHTFLLEETDRRWSYEIHPVHHDPDGEDHLSRVLDGLPADGVCGFAPVDPPFWIVIGRRPVSWA